MLLIIESWQLSYRVQNSTDKNINAVWHRKTVARQLRETQNEHKLLILWMTGFSSAGKSALAHILEDCCDYPLK